MGEMNLNLDKIASLLFALAGAISIIIGAYLSEDMKILVGLVALGLSYILQIKITLEEMWEE